MAQTKSLNFSPSTLAKMKSAAFHDGGNKLAHVFNLPLNFDLNPIIFVYKKNVKFRNMYISFPLKV